VWQKERRGRGGGKDVSTKWTNEQMSEHAFAFGYMGRREHDSG